MSFTSRFVRPAFARPSVSSTTVWPALLLSLGCGEASQSSGTPVASVTNSASTTPPVAPAPGTTSGAASSSAPAVPPPGQTPPVAPVPVPATTTPQTTGTPPAVTSAPTTSSTMPTTTAATTSEQPSQGTLTETGETSEASGSSAPPGSGDACPANATFCSGFESPDLPEGAVFKLNGDPATPWTTNFNVDSTQKNSGNSSLKVVSANAGVGSYKMLAVPSGGATFWARFYIRSDVELGVHDHNAFAIASTSDDPNSGGVEFAEDVGLSFNTSDNVKWPEGFGRTMSGGEMPYSLPANEWHCIELGFDGTGRVQQLFIAGEQTINATMYPASAVNFTTFKFGYNAFHSTVRALWYDDVAVAPSRIGCL